MNIKRALPWQLKLAIKIILSRLPVGYYFWQRLGLFKLGAMEEPELALKIFNARFSGICFAERAQGFTALELGPGDTLFSALIASGYGAGECYLVDVGRFARRDMRAYGKMLCTLEKHGLCVPHIHDATTLDDLLRMTNTHYLTRGLESLKSIPDCSVDFIWSSAVLEHIRAVDFVDTLYELRRVIRPTGVCSHWVDLKDHLGDALNNLRFPAKVWECELMASSGFYTNRIRYKQMLRHFETSGFEVEVRHVDRWHNLPTPRSKFSPDFNKLADDDLLVSSFDVILRPR